METLAVVGAGTLVLGGPLAWAMLLNLRDRRAARLLHSVMDQVSSRDLRGHIAVHVRCSALSPRSVVTVDLFACSREQVWEIMARLSQRFAPHVRLEVTGLAERQFLATFTVETTSRRPLLRTAQPTWATG